MASKFVTILEKIGSEFEKGLIVVQPYAVALEPFVAAANPAIGGMYALTVNTVGLVEQKFAAMGKQSGTGAQKSAEALQVLEPYILQAFGTKDASVAKTYLDAIVALLNLPISVKN
jgi:hypothetical protein